MLSNFCIIYLQLFLHRVRGHVLWPIRCSEFRCPLFEQWFPHHSSGCYDSRLTPGNVSFLTNLMAKNIPFQPLLIIKTQIIMISLLTNTQKKCFYFSRLVLQYTQNLLRVSFWLLCILYGRPTLFLIFRVILIRKLEDGMF